MPESQEKRQRARRKQRKRQEKLEAKVMRNSQKRNSTVAGNSLRFFVLWRGDDEHLVDSVLWLGMLNLASHHGWAPHGSEPDEEINSWDYVRPRRLHVSSDEAEGLARSVEVELPNLGDDPAELPEHMEYGEDHTEFLVSMRLEGRTVDEREIGETRLVLSGPTKKDARKLVAFLHGGEFSVEEN